jgi:ammonia channel protein AmtB
MFFAPWAAAITGLMGGLAYLGVSLLMAKLRVDDPVGVW